MRELVIIGGGPAGLTAAVYARRAGIDVLVCEGNMYGGQLISAESVKNYPSYPAIEGWELAQNMFNHAKEYDTEFLYETVTGVTKNEGYLTVSTADKSVDCMCVIIANGSKRKRIGCKGSDKFEGAGISYCATCDGQLYKGKDVAVVGGSETAFEDVLYLSSLCNTVYLCAKSITASEEWQETVRDKDNIKVFEGFYPTEIYGEVRPEGVIISDKSGNSEDLKISGVFAALGVSKDNSVFGNVAKLEKNGYFESDESCKTFTEGVFVAGDSRAKTLRQIVTAVSDGAVAATAASAYIMKKRKK